MNESGPTQIESMAQCIEKQQERITALRADVVGVTRENVSLASELRQVRARMGKAEAARRDAQETRFALIIENEALVADLADASARVECAEEALERCVSLADPGDVADADYCAACANVQSVARAALGAAGEKDESSEAARATKAAAALQSLIVDLREGEGGGVMAITAALEDVCAILKGATDVATD